MRRSFGYLTVRNNPTRSAPFHFRNNDNTTEID